MKAVSKRYGNVRPAPACDRLKVGVLELFFAELKAKVGARELRLTPTEMKVLSFLMVNAGRVLSREQIADGALGYRSTGESNAVEVYIQRLRTKLEGEAGSPVLIETVARSGYRLRRVEAAKSLAS